MGNQIGHLFSRNQTIKVPKILRLPNIFSMSSRNNDDDDEDQHNKDDDEILEVGKSSASGIDAPAFLCEICITERPLYNSFNPKGCTHFYCIKCVIRYVVSKLDDNVTVILCPVSGCKGVLEPEYCRDILPDHVFDWWGIALCESVIDCSMKFYCPYVDCSALLINDIGGGVGIENKLVCPSCKREFCFKCKAPWHSEFSCAKFKKLQKQGGDDMLKYLAKRKKWRKCPTCKVYVEKSAGCYHMKCRCGYTFCYKCGGRSSDTTHICSTCKH